jgi:hypothetical protein
LWVFRTLGVRGSAGVSAGGHCAVACRPCCWRFLGASLVSRPDASGLTPDNNTHTARLSRVLAVLGRAGRRHWSRGHAASGRRVPAGAARARCGCRCGLRGASTSSCMTLVGICARGSVASAGWCTHRELPASTFVLRGASVANAPLFCFVAAGLSRCPPCVRALAAEGCLSVGFRVGGGSGGGRRAGATCPGPRIAAGPSRRGGVAALTSPGGEAARGASRRGAVRTFLGGELGRDVLGALRRGGERRDSESSAPLRLRRWRFRGVLRQGRSRARDFLVLSLPPLAVAMALEAIRPALSVGLVPVRREYGVRWRGGFEQRGCDGAWRAAGGTPQRFLEGGTDRLVPTSCWWRRQRDHVEGAGWGRNLSRAVCRGSPARGAWRCSPWLRGGCG